MEPDHRLCTHAGVERSTTEMADAIDRNADTQNLCREVNERVAHGAEHSSSHASRSRSRKRSTFGPNRIPGISPAR